MVSDVLDDSDGIIQEILDKSEMTRQELMDKIQEKIEEYGGLLTEAGAAYSIAKSMGIRKGKEKVTENGEEVKLSEIKEDMSNVNVEARVKRVYMTREFSSNKNSGNVTNVDIKDDSGEGRVVLWDKKDLAEKLERNTPLKIINGYVKKNNDRLEINIGRYGSIEVMNGKETNILEMKNKERKIEDIEEGMDDVDLYARVERIYPMNTFTRKTSSGEERQGKVSNALITDGKNKTRLVLWGEHAEEAQKLSKNDLIKVEGGYVKENRERNELHIGWRGRLKINPKTDVEIPEVKVNRKKITEINEQEEGEFETRATIVQAYDPKIMETCPDCNSIIKQGECQEHGEITQPGHMAILNVILDDGTGALRATAFRENAEKLLGKKAEEILDNGEEIKKQALGEEKIFTLRKKQNPNFDEDDHIINSITNINIEKEINIIQREK